MKYKELLFLSRAVLESQFNEKLLEVPNLVKEKYSYKGACFITLTKEGSLRGCIGSLEPVRLLYEDVIENTINAGFRDPRFLELDEEELDLIKIEISILTPRKKLGIGKKIFNKINKNMGIVLNYKGRSATFLPQVWEQIPDKEVFLEQLSLKAGLFKEDWKESEIEFYEVEKIKEE